MYIWKKKKNTKSEEKLSNIIGILDRIEVVTRVFYNVDKLRRFVSLT